jgi:predicted kinase
MGDILPVPRGRQNGDVRTDTGILVLAGPPCAGKSSVGRALVAGPAEGRCVRLEVDSLFLLLLPGSDRNRRDRMLAYDAAHAVARTVLESGATPVLECTYARVDQRASLVRALADQPEAPLWVVELSVTPDEAVRRFRDRDQATDLDEALLRERVEAFPYSDMALLLDSSSPAQELAGRVNTWLQGEPPPVRREAWVASGRGWD